MTNNQPPGGGPGPVPVTLYGETLIWNVNVLGGGPSGDVNKINDQYQAMKNVYNGPCNVLPLSLIQFPYDETQNIQNLFFNSTEGPNTFEYDLFFSTTGPAFPPDALTLMQAGGGWLSTHPRLIEVFVVSHVYGHPRGAPENLTTEDGGLSVSDPTHVLPDDPHIFFSGSMISRPDSAGLSYNWLLAHEFGHEFNLDDIPGDLNNVMSKFAPFYSPNVDSNQCTTVRKDTVHLDVTQ
jgi:hypothetical protein